mmetsp:Transcript_25791/g.42346  ORF Transcript_25791/g.42346 Transcript_25791/m.42346 type:complete len:215 (+) Transcript_25791:1334-1978(+)
MRLTCGAVSEGRIFFNSACSSSTEIDPDWFLSAKQNVLKASAFSLSVRGFSAGVTSLVFLTGEKGLILLLLVVGERPLPDTLSAVPAVWGIVSGSSCFLAGEGLLGADCFLVVFVCNVITRFATPCRNSAKPIRPLWLLSSEVITFLASVTAEGRAFCSSEREMKPLRSLSIARKISYASHTSRHVKEFSEFSETALILPFLPSSPTSRTYSWN